MSEDDAIMARFVRDYLELLDHRVESIEHHLSTGNFLTAHVALLSLESTSVMVGAAGLAEVAGRIRAAVERGDRAAMPALVEEMAAAAAHTHMELGRPSAG